MVLRVATLLPKAYSPPHWFGNIVVFTNAFRRRFAELEFLDLLRAVAYGRIHVCLALCLRLRQWDRHEGLCRIVEKFGCNLVAFGYQCCVCGGHELIDRSPPVVHPDRWLEGWRVHAHHGWRPEQQAGLVGGRQ